MTLVVNRSGTDGGSTDPGARQYAARRGGALVHEQIECKFGIDLGEAALSLAIGERPDVTIAERVGIMGSTYITSPRVCC
ncbi:hypothetical protein [Streptomyces sp. NPDC001601]|uniref:hypothetical protein n=1 Tax=Streptomyces sp. NPDC001601 TaxID=3364592 RepID=UPI00368C97A8